MYGVYPDVALTGAALFAEMWNLCYFAVATAAVLRATHRKASGPAPR